MSKTIRLSIHTILVLFFFIVFLFSQEQQQIELEPAEEVLRISLSLDEYSPNSYIRIFAEEEALAFKPVKIIRNGQPLWFKIITGEFSDTQRENSIEILDEPNAILIDRNQLGSNGDILEIELVFSGKVDSDFDLKIEELSSPAETTAASSKSIKIILKNKN